MDKNTFLTIEQDIILGLIILQDAGVIKQFGMKKWDEDHENDFLQFELFAVQMPDDNIKSYPHHEIWHFIDNKLPNFKDQLTDYETN